MSFIYPNRAGLVLNKVSFEVLPQTTTGIIGETGSGKSTISQLILRFYSPDKGNIFIEGISIEKFDVYYLR